MGPSPVDHTEELVRAMLARRADRPAPAWLTADISEAVAASPRARGSGGRPATATADRRGRATALVLAAALLLGMVGGGLLVAALLRAPVSPLSGQAGAAVDPSATAGASFTSGTGVAGGPTAPPQAGESQQAGASPEPANLAPDSLAVVTKAGEPLLVRAAPRLGVDSAKIDTLPSETRLLVLSGPVTADGYDWYEVLTDGQPIRRYGWVARGTAQEEWLAPSPPRCWPSLNASTLLTVSRIDILACYHDTELTVRGRWRELTTAEIGVNPCQWDEVIGPCNAKQAWLLAPSVRITYQTEDGTSGSVDVAVPTALRARLDAVPHNATLSATIAMDVPEARSCSVGGPAVGSAPRPADRAVAACRVRWALRNVAWNDGKVRATSVAQVAVDRLPVMTAPDAAAQTAGRALRSGDRVYVAQGPRRVNGTDWYAVLWQDRDTVYGWVPGAQSGHRTLAARPPVCPGIADWAAFKELVWWERLACFGGRTVSADMWLRMSKPQPELSLSCGYWAMKATTGSGGRPAVADTTCVASPAWLAGVTGLLGERPGGIETMLAYDPTKVDVSALGTGTRWLRVTGSFNNPAASECRVLNQGTGLDLVPPAEAAIYCDSVFVVTSLEPASGPEPE